MTTNLGKRYARYVQCKRCGVDMEYGRHITHRTFCSTACRESWWSDNKIEGVTQQMVATRRGGECQPVTLTERQKIWLAALFDGEGTISIWRERRPENRSGFRFRAVAEIYNTNQDLIDAVMALADGHVRVKGKPGPTDNHRMCYKVSWRRRSVRSLLEEIRPYLVAKTQQANLVIRFCKEQEAAPMRASQAHEILETLWADAQALNRRGARQESEVPNGRE